MLGITLNIFIPADIVQKLKDVKITGRFDPDWRYTAFCHCTVKAIHVGDQLPNQLKAWAEAAGKVLANQKAFKVSVKNVERFPQIAIYAGIQSPELVNLHRRLGAFLPSSQPQFDNEAYIPHASMANLTGPAEVLSDVHQDFGMFEASEIQLMVWDLEKLGQAVVHTRFKLAKG